MPRFLTTSLILLLQLTAPASVAENNESVAKKQNPSQTKTSATQPKRFYVVKPGETLYRIGIITGIGHQKLAEWNNLPPSYLVKSGQTLKLYPGTSTNPVKGEITKTESAPKTNTPTPIASPEKQKAEPSERVAISPLSDSIKITPLNDPRTEKARKQPSTDTAKTASKPEPSNAAYQPSAGKRIPSTPPEHHKPTDSNAKNTTINSKAANKPANTKNIAKSEGKKRMVSNNNKNMLKLNFQWPLKGIVLENLSNTNTKGVGIASRLDKQAVKAAETGKVVYQGQGLDGYHDLIVIKHSGDFLTVYANNSRILVKEGEQIRKGQTIAEILAANGKQRPLHFEIRKAGRPINTLPLLPARH